MNSATIEYNRKVWEFLETMKPDVTYSVSKLAKPENQGAFITAVKEYMDTRPWQGWLSFNKDYTKIYKTHPIKFEK
jgi:hypothetical protein